MQYHYHARRGEEESVGTLEVKKDLDFVRLQRDLGRLNWELRRVDAEEYEGLKLTIKHNGFVTKFRG